MRLFQKRLVVFARSARCRDNHIEGCGAGRFEQWGGGLVCQVRGRRSIAVLQFPMSAMSSRKSVASKDDSARGTGFLSVGSTRAC